MAYKRVVHGHGRHIIVDRECPPAEMRITSNLADNEFKIELLIARNCPIRKSCVRIEQEVNSICDHVAHFTLSGGDGSIYARLPASRVIRLDSWRYMSCGSMAARWGRTAPVARIC